MAKILYIEDDSLIAVRVKEWLSKEGHTVEIADNGNDGLQLLSNFQYDIILLDWSMPDLTGLEVCARYRRDGGKSWIIFLTGNSQIENKEEGFSVGADDYLTKPFDIRELSARVKSALRRSDTMFQTELTIGSLTLDTSKRIAYVSGVPLHLMPKESAVLEFLMRHPGKIFGSKALLEAVWPSKSEASETTVRTFVGSLRKKLNAGGAVDFIKTVPSLGYTIEMPSNSDNLNQQN